MVSEFETILIENIQSEEKKKTFEKLSVTQRSVRQHQKFLTYLLLKLLKERK